MRKNKDKQKEDNKLSDVLLKIKSSDDNLKPYAERFVRFYQLYRSHLDPDKWPTKSRMFNPLVFSLIETQTAKMMSTKPMGEWKPATEGAKGDPEKIQMAFDKWWRDERGTFKAQDMFKKTSMYGGASAQVYWKFVKGYKLGKPFNKIDRPSIRVLRLEDQMFGFDPEADSFEDCKWAFIRYPITKKQLVDLKSSPLVGAYKDIDKAIASFSSSDPYDDKGLMQERKDVIGAKNVSDETIKKAECIYLENYETGENIIVVGRKHVIMDGKNAHLAERSLILTNNVRVPSEIVGMGDIEPIESLQHGANLFRNQRADNIDSILRPQWLSATDSEADDDELTDEDSLVVHCKDISKVKQLPKENVTGTAFKEDEVIKNDIYAATSVTPFSMGNDNDIKSDKSGVAIGKLQGASDARIKSKLMNFEISFIKEVAEKWQRLMAQYQRDNITIDDSGETITITPEDLGFSEDGDLGEWNFNVESGSTQHVNDTESREDYLAFHTKIIELAELKKNATMQPEPQIDPMTQQPIQAPIPAQILDYDKLAEKLSEKFGQKDWREIWIMEDKNAMMQPVEGEMLPGIDAEQQGGEMLPDGQQGQQEEMLPSVGEPQQQEMLPGVEGQPQQGEMLPGVGQQQEMLPPIQKKGMFNKLKSLFKGKSKEMLPPV